MAEFGGRLEGDSGTPYAERHIAGVVELQWFLQFKSCPCVFIRTKRTVESVSYRRRADSFYRDIFNAVSFAVNIKSDDVSCSDVGGAAYFNIGVSWLGIH